MSEFGRVARVAAQAKINLFLRVLAREDCGYHQIETLFLRIGLSDVVRVRHTAHERSLDVSGDVDLGALGPVERNLAWRAAVAYADASEWRGGFAIEVEKHIPIGGGLGGGSADAAAVLRAMQALSDAPLESHLHLALPLGADVPFLASDAAYALAWGRGERMMALPAPPERDLLLVVPAFGVSTPEAYGWIDALGRPTVGASVRDLSSLSEWTRIVQGASNDFEGVVAARHREVAGVRQQLNHWEALLVGMTGSGSTMFGLYETAAAAQSVAQRIDVAGVRVIPTRTASHVEPVEIIE